MLSYRKRFAPILKQWKSFPGTPQNKGLYRPIYQDTFAFDTEATLIGYKNTMLKSSTFYTFDFFDTLFHRPAGHWAQFYYQLARLLQKRRLIPGGEDIVTLFANERMECEQIARHKKSKAAGHPEIGLPEVYELMQKSFPLSEGIQPADYASIEFNLDSNLLAPNHQLITRIIASGINYAVVSDTFYTGRQLARHLSSNKLNPRFIYASCEHSDGKHATLFKKVAQNIKEIGIKIDNVIHIGDNYHSDFIKPQENGIGAIHIPYGDSSFWENDALAAQWRQECFGESNPNENPAIRMVAATSCGIGIYLNDKLQYDQTSYYSYGYRELGPLLLSFSMWLVKISEILNPVSILFMMREGEILHKCFNAVNHKSIPSSKFFISRRAAAQASILIADRDELTSLNFGSATQTVNDYINILPIEDEKIKSEIKDRFPAKLMMPVRAMLDELVDYIISNEKVVGHIRRTATKNRRGLIGHLETLLPADTLQGFRSVLLVDVGWNGTIQKLLNKILNADDVNSPIKIIGAYILTTSSAPSSAIAFLSNRSTRSLATRIFMRSPEIIEQCTSSVNFGTTIGYCDATGNPITKDIDPSDPRLLDTALIQEGIIDFIKFSEPYQGLLMKDNSESDRDWLFAQLLRQTCNPTAAEIELFRDWSHDDNLIKDNSIPICVQELGPWITRAPARLMHQVTMSECYWPYPLWKKRFSSPAKISQTYRNECSKDAIELNCMYSYLSVYGFNLNHRLGVQCHKDVSGCLFIQSSGALASSSPPFRATLHFATDICAFYKIDYIYIRWGFLGNQKAIKLDQEDVIKMIRSKQLVIHDLSLNSSSATSIPVKGNSCQANHLITNCCNLHYIIDRIELCKLANEKTQFSASDNRGSDLSSLEFSFKAILSPSQS